jgi:hypothetical protein
MRLLGRVYGLPGKLTQKPSGRSGSVPEASRSLDRKGQRGDGRPRPSGFWRFKPVLRAAELYSADGRGRPSPR